MTIRIIAGTAYTRKSLDNCFRVKVTDLGHGHTETVVTQGWEWVEMDLLQRMTDFERKNYLEVLEELKNDPAAIAERERINQERAAKRAKTRVRQLCKAANADTLMTLTYRSNQTDLDLCKKHLKEFVRRVRRVIPDFVAIAAFEPQKRGAWHVHMACRRIATVLPGAAGVRMKSFDLLRSIWRSVTKEHGGNVDVARRKQTAQRSPARIAAYISKYITKAFEQGAKFSNRWTKFGDVTVPPSVQLGYVGSMREALGLVYDLLGDNVSVVTSYLSRFKDVFFLVTEERQGRDLCPPPEQPFF